MIIVNLIVKYYYMHALHLKNLLKYNPIAVTGIGILTAAGSNTLWESVKAGKTFGKFLDIANESIKIPICVVRELEVPTELKIKYHKLDRSARLAINAAKGAMKNANIDNEAIRKNSGLIVGTSRGAVELLSQLFTNRRKIPPSYSPNTSIGGLSGALAMALGIKGISFTVSANCASSAVSIAMAAEQLLLGCAESMIAGGAEAPINPAILIPMLNAGILGKGDNPETVCKPFDINRNGTILGEGAGFLFLEKLSSAIKRKANIRAILAGWAIKTAPISSVGVDETGESLAEVIEEALQIADVTPRDISFISAHGTGTHLNDLAEARAIKRVFGNTPVPVYSIKPVTGHCLGASSAIESAVAIDALNNKVIPPTVNCLEKDSECDINVVTKHPIEIKNPVAALVISSGFWGHQSILVFKRISSTAKEI